MVVRKKKVGDDPKKSKQEWDNPNNPEAAKDTREFEQLKRQAKEAERRKENLEDSGETESDDKK
jgi:hypothetical protein